MPFRPDEIIVHHDLDASYESWRALAARGRQPAQAVWHSVEAAIAQLRAKSVSEYLTPESDWDLFVQEL